jgi:hypothetical protein
MNAVALAVFVKQPVVLNTTTNAVVEVRLRGTLVRYDKRTVRGEGVAVSRRHCAVCRNSG